MQEIAIKIVSRRKKVNAVERYMYSLRHLQKWFCSVWMIKILIILLTHNKYCIFIIIILPAWYCFFCFQKKSYSCMPCSLVKYQGWKWTFLWIDVLVNTCRENSRIQHTANDINTLYQTQLNKICLKPIKLPCTNPVNKLQHMLSITNTKTIKQNVAITN